MIQRYRYAVYSGDEGASSPGKVHLLYEPRYVIPCVGNLTEEKSCVSMSEFSIDI
jgi:hypothetical protein